MWPRWHDLEEIGYSRQYEVRLGLILSDYSANWHSQEVVIVDVSAGSLSIC